MVAPDDITWKCSEAAFAVFKPYRDGNDEGYWAGVTALRRLLCEYFNAEGKCQAPRTGISPTGAAGDGKILKVRWGIPGRGKRGGWRLTVVVFCSARRVVIDEVVERRDA